MLRKPKTSEKAEALRKVPLFAPCTPAELNEIAGLAAEADCSCWPDFECTAERIGETIACPETAPTDTRGDVE